MKFDDHPITLTFGSMDTDQLRLFLEQRASCPYKPCVRLNSDGERIAGQRKRRKIEAEIKWSLSSSFPLALSLDLSVAKHSLSSLPKKKNHD
jgi:hypothetical protein